MSTDLITEEAPVTTEEPQTAVETPPPALEIPEKFRGKSMEDVVKSYVNLEQEYGRSRQEVGELRQLADRFIQRDLAPQKPEPVVVEEKDFFDDPEEAVGKTIKAALKPIQEELELARRQTALAKLTESHPDANTLVWTPEFQQWVKESPMRTRMFRDANDRFDLEAAHELLGNFKALQATNAQQIATAKADQAHTQRAATLETGSTGETGNKVWRRADLIQMRMRNPDKYALMQDEILAAYQDGRVR